VLGAVEHCSLHLLLELPATPLPTWRCAIQRAQPRCRCGKERRRNRVDGVNVRGYAVHLAMVVVLSWRWERTLIVEASSSLFWPPCALLLHRVAKAPAQLRNTNARMTVSRSAQELTDCARNIHDRKNE